MCSTMMTEPSTIRPKSIAPRLMTEATVPVRYIIPKAKSSDSGMTRATTMPARRLPSSSTSTKMTISPPSARLTLTVRMTRETSSSRSR